VVDTNSGNQPVISSSNTAAQINVGTDGSSGVNTLLTVQGGATLSSPVDIGSGTGSTGAVVITGGATLTGSVIVGGSGAGSLTLSGGGVVEIPSGNALVVASAGGSSGTVNLNSGGTLELGGTNGLQAGSGVSSFNWGGGTVQVINSDLATSIAATLVNATTSTLNTNGFNATFSGVLSGGGALTKTGTGTLTLSGANTYSGGTILNAGSLDVSNDDQLGASGSALTINGGTFTSTAGVTIDRPLSGTGGIIATTGSNSLVIGTLSVPNAVNYQGSVSVGAGTSVTVISTSVATVGNIQLAANAQIGSTNGIQLYAATPGTSADSLTTATNASTTILGLFKLNGGTINGPTSAGKSLSVEGTLGGGGVINGNVHPFSVNPGDPAEQLYTETHLPLDTVTLSIATNSPTPGPTTGYDIIHNNGSITLNSDFGSTFTVLFVDGYTPVLGDSFHLIQATGTITGDYDAGDGGTEDFPGLPQGLAWDWQPSLGTLSLVIPEPSDYASIAGVAMLAFVIVRRRRNRAAKQSQTEKSA
jgi:autotransporter-associated beta strand protein